MSGRRIKWTQSHPTPRNKKQKEKVTTTSIQIPSDWWVINHSINRRYMIFIRKQATLFCSIYRSGKCGDGWIRSTAFHGVWRANVIIFHAHILLWTGICFNEAYQISFKSTDGQGIFLCSFVKHLLQTCQQVQAAAWTGNSIDKEAYNLDSPFYWVWRD
jgi:hypothetical protein